MNQRHTMMIKRKKKKGYEDKKNDDVGTNAWFSIIMDLCHQLKKKRS